MSHRLANLLSGEHLAARPAGARCGRQLRHDLIGAQCAAEFLQTSCRVLLGRGECARRAVVGRQVTLLSWVGEERHRRLGVNQDQVVDLLELHRRHLCEIGDALDSGQSSAALQSRGESFCIDLDAGLGGDARGGQQGAFAKRAGA